MRQDARQAAVKKTAGELGFLAGANLEASGIVHGFFLRTGGVSEGVYASLNCGRGSADDRDRVEENRARVAATLGAGQGVLTGPRQAHTARAVIVTAAWQPGDAPEADAVVTNIRGLAVSVLTADCAPVLLADAQAGVVAAAHAGWKGAKAGIVESAIDAMEKLGARAARIEAAIGPAILQAAYEVSPEFKAAFLADGQANERYFTQADGHRPYFNLAGYVKDRLLSRGVTNIQDIGACTYENESILFSYRRSVHRSEPDYGRQISAILLQ
ncbi:MAG: peptidoglycan editing factor PgeF [Rhodomicrobium sp.]